MADHEPTAELAQRFSSDDAAPTSWAQGRERLEQAQVYWLSTVRPDGRPHVTPLVAVWLEHDPRVVITTGSDVLDGLDVVVEGDDMRVRDEARLQRVAQRYGAKYEPPFHFVVRDGAFYGEGAEDDGDGGLVFEVAPTKAFGFGKGETFSQTRWRFL